MKNYSFISEQKRQEEILKEKLNGTPDIEIGEKYGVSFNYIEKVITKMQGVNVNSFKTSKKIKTLHPKNFREEQTSVWSFKQRGSWATHSSEYRGNWSPYIPRNVIFKYSKPNELVLDYFCGAGTTAVECKLLGRKCIALDINDKAIELAKKNVDFEVQTEQLNLFNSENKLKIYEPKLMVGDARDLSFLKDNSVDLISAHPPYANIIQYTNSKEGDLSFYGINEFLNEMEKVAKESYRVLKPGRKCAILIGDTRRKKHVIPLGFMLINVFLEAGFKLKELVIKRQHNCRTSGFWYTNSIKYNFLLLAHEYLPIFEKPVEALSYNAMEVNDNYSSSLIPSFRRLPLKKEISSFETTTVWVLPKDQFEQILNKNVIDRYSKGKEYLAMSFNSHNLENEKTFKTEKKQSNLFFIKSPVLNKTNISNSEIESYLVKLKENIMDKLSNISRDGFIVVQTKDVRIGGYIEPLAKRIIDFLKSDKLWLKEIIIVTQNETDSIPYNFKKSKEHLEIVHQYLLVYEVVNQE